MKKEEIIIGRRAVLEAIFAGRRAIQKIMVARSLRGITFREIIDEAEKAGITVQEVDRKRIRAIARTDEHQGVIALASPLSDETLTSIMARAKVLQEDPFIVIVDGVTDPQNLGAILRTAEAAGAHGVIVSSRKTAPLDRATTKASSGAVEHIPVIKVGNLGQCIMRLKEEGVFVFATHVSSSAKSIYNQDLSGPLAILLGSEGKGLPPSLVHKCDAAIHIPLRGKIKSLNVSAAAAAILFEASRQRTQNLQRRTVT